MTGPGDHRPPDDRAGFLGWYQRAWNDLDLDRILAAYATRCFVVKGGRVLHHRDDAAKARYFADLLDGNRRQGPHRWDLSDLEQRPLGRDGALVTVSWTCRRPDGSAIWEFLDSYLLAGERGRWWIVGDVVHEEPQEEPP
jgi:hypothetical protein